MPPFEQKGGSRQIYNTKITNQVFLWYWYGKYQEKTNQYRPKIPNCYPTLVKKPLLGYNLGR
jgi:hypothetical protein